ncbi:hypothetical protein ACLB2K_004568 [Fragaria x ananassa]
MIGAVQLGLVAACVVVLVPMGMAGYHLSRNKMLFFSGALFITLAIGVHLTPYFPSVTDFVTSVVVFQNRRDSCLSHLHDVVWDVTPDNSTASLTYHKSWAWDASSSSVSACGFQKLARFEAADLLNGSWVAVAGDSQARLVAVSLLNLVLDPERMDKIRSDLFKRHSDYQIVVDEIGMSRAASLVSSSEHEEAATGSVLARPPPHLFWIGMPTLINSMLNSEEKRDKMTDALRAAYDEQLRQSNLVRQSSGPFLLLDVESLSWNCGVRCTEDGMHYDMPVYEAALHIMLNALLIESHQKL